MVRLMISPAFAALVWATPYVSTTRTAAWVTPRGTPIRISSRVHPPDFRSVAIRPRQASADRAYRANSTTRTGSTAVAVWADR